MFPLTKSDDAHLIVPSWAQGSTRIRAIASVRWAFRGSPDGSTWRVLRQDDYRRYVTGNACSNLGTWLQNTAQVLLAYRLTHSAGGVAVVTFAQFGGILVIGPFVGVVVDRFDRRRLLVVCQLLSALIASVLAFFEFFGLLTQPLLVTGAASMGLVYAFAFPAQSAIVPSLVGPGDRRAAMAMNVVSDNVGRALAPAVGVVLVSTIGFGWAFALNALSFLVFFAALSRVRCRPPACASELPASRPRFMDGFRMAIREPKVLQLLIIAALITVATDPIMVLGPSLSHSALHVPAVRSGYLIAAFGCGTVLGALVRVERLVPRIQLALSVILLYAAVALYVESRSFPLTAVAAFVAGVAFLIALAAVQTLLLGNSRPQRAGSIMAIWAFAHCGSRPPTSLIDGWLADTHHGAQWAGIMVISAAAAVLALVAAPELQEDRLKQWRPAWQRLWRAPSAAIGAPRGD